MTWFSVALLQVIDSSAQLDAEILSFLMLATNPRLRLPEFIIMRSGFGIVRKHSCAPIMNKALHMMRLSSIDFCQTRSRYYFKLDDELKTIL